MKRNKPRQSRSARWDGGRDRKAGFRKTAEGELYITGLNGVRECLASPHVKVSRVWADPGRVPAETGKVLAAMGDRVSGLQGKDSPYGPASQGIAALVTREPLHDLDDFLDNLEPRTGTPLLVALDQVEDPMNLGQILRTCEGAGVDGLILLRHRSIHLNQTVAQVSQGAFAWVPVIEATNLRQCLESAKERGFQVVGCEGAAEASPWHQVDLTGMTLLVFGSEGRGLRPLTRKTCDHLAALPMHGRLNSLNVGAAVSAFLYETIRQRIAHS
ncbi:MAG: RNA methyltransferase [Acidobacteriota bacterium]|nr:RNA methyltransferase [Acidobacteriota bacterium]